MARQRGGIQPAPVAVFNSSALQVQLPENVVTLDLSASYDESKRAKNQIVLYEITQVSGAQVAFTNDTGKTKDAVFPKVPGPYTFKGVVTDGARKPLSDEEQVTIELLREPMIWGASGKGVTPNVLKTLFGEKTVTREGILASIYKGGGDQTANNYLNAGIPVFLNINMYPYRDSEGVRTGTPFLKDMDELRKLLNPILDFYKDHPKKDIFHASYLNEPTTQVFNTGPMEDYLAGLAVFVEECVKRGLKCTDGGVHVDTVLGTDLGSTGEGNAKDVATLINGYAKIKGMYAILLHTSNGNNNSYDGSRIAKAVKIIKDATGYNVITNEWHIQDKSDQKDQVDPKVLVDAAQGWVDADKQYGIEFNVYITGTSDKNCPIVNDNGVLTKYGQPYINFIAGLKQAQEQKTSTLRRNNRLDRKMGRWQRSG